MDTFCISFPHDTQCVGDERQHETYLQAMKWYVRAKNRMAELKIRQEDLADALGMTRGGIGHYLSGRREPTLEQLKLIAKVLKMSRAELVDGDGEPTDWTETQADSLIERVHISVPRRKSFAFAESQPAVSLPRELQSRMDRPVTYPVPRLDVHASMGNGMAIRDVVEVIEFVNINVPELCRSRGVSVSAPENLRIVTGYGSSMRPLYDHLDPLLVDVGINDLKIDDVYCLENNDELFIKRIQRVPGKKDAYMMMSDNKAFKDFEIEDPIRNGFKVLARVVIAMNLVKV